MAEDRYPNLRIFISHSHKDNDFGHQLVHDLRYFFGNDKYVWYDSAGGLIGGDDWWSSIKKELVRSNKFIVLLSKEALSPKKWVDQEIRLAWPRYVDKRLRIIPILCDDCRVPSRLLDIRSLQIISCRTADEYKKSFRDIIRALRLPGDAIIHFQQRELSHIETMYKARCMDEVIQSTSFLLSYFPETVSTSVYWGRTFAFAEKRDWLQSQEAFQVGLKKITDLDLHVQWVNTYLNFLLKKGLLEEAIALTTQLLTWTPYPEYVSGLHKRFLQYNTREQAFSSPYQPSDKKNNFNSQQTAQVSVPPLLNQFKVPQTNNSDSQAFYQLHVLSSERKGISEENHFQKEEINISNVPEVLQGLTHLSWVQRCNIFIEQKMHYPHPKEMFGNTSYIILCGCNLFFLLIVALSLPTIPLIGPGLVLPIALMLVGGKLISNQSVRFFFAALLAAVWSLGGYLLVETVVNLDWYLHLMPNLLEIMKWAIFVFAGLWGFFWHWELFKQVKKNV